MSVTTTLPVCGDEYSYSVLVQAPLSQFQQDSPFRPNRAKHVFGWHDVNGTRKLTRLCRVTSATGRCDECDGIRETRTSTVVEVQHFMDNSVEVLLADGHRAMIVVPSGDVCF